MSVNIRSRCAKVVFGAALVWLGAQGPVQADEDAGMQVAEKLQRVVGLSLGMIQKEEYSKLPVFFHFPVGYSEGELKRDACLITKGMDALVQVFGVPENIRPPQKAGEIQHYSIYVRSADSEYWKHRDILGKTSFYADFPEVGPGVVNFRFEDLTTGRPKIRSIAFGLQTSEDGAKEKLIKLGKKFSDLVTAGRAECDGLLPKTK